MRSSTNTLIGALRVLANEIESPDGVANAAIAEAAQRMMELQSLLQAALPHVKASAQAEHAIDGHKPRHHPYDALLKQIKEALDM